MKIYNTLTKKIEEFAPHNKDRVTFYSCGPTVYHYAHIGNLRNYVCNDLLDRTLRYIGYKVERCMNITDVGHLKSDSDSGEDKMVASAKKEHKSVLDIAKFYTDAFFKDFDALNCKRPEIVSNASDNIDMYIKIIEKLLKDGYAYQAGGNVYFDVSKLDDYYKLTNHKEDEMVVGVRDGVEFDGNKKNQADFALWFTKSKFEDQELKWNSPFGVGYPGWHIECSGISIKNLGEYLDIHTGGVDNIFPHHTNEIAQSEAYLGHKWGSYWVHTEHLMSIDGKMSKSHGDVVTVDSLVNKGYNPLSFRYMCLNSHYRKQLIFSFDALNAAENEYKKLKNKIANLKEDGMLSDGDFENYTNLFTACITDDLNTANAITVIYSLLKDETVNGTTKIELIRSFDRVLALDLLKKDEAKREDHDLIMKLIEKRNNAKKSKDYELADSIRDELYSKGIKLIDTREGTTYEEV